MSALLGPSLPGAGASPLGRDGGGENMEWPVDNLWIVGGFAAFTAGFQALIAGLWWTIGGLGALRRINNSLAKFEDDIHHLDTRLSREQKVRASVAAADARKGGDVKLEAAELLAAEASNAHPSGGQGRPTTAHLIAR